MSPRPQLLTSDGDRLQTLICLVSERAPPASKAPCAGPAPLTCGDLSALPPTGWPRAQAAWHTARSGLLLFCGQVRGEDPQLLLLPLQLVGQLALCQALLVEEDEVPGGVVGGDVGEVHPALLQLLQAAEPGGATGTTRGAGAPSRSSGFPPRREMGQGGRAHGARPPPPRPALLARLSHAPPLFVKVLKVLSFLPVSTSCTPPLSTAALSTAAFLTLKGPRSMTSKLPFL